MVQGQDVGAWGRGAWTALTAILMAVAFAAPAQAQRTSLESLAADHDDIQDVQNSGADGIFATRLFLTSSGGIPGDNAKSVVTGNNVAGNGGDGINAENGATISGNTATDNVGAGISGGRASTISGNAVHANGSNGISADVGSNVTKNLAATNDLPGIRVICPSKVSGNVSTGHAPSNLQVVGVDCLVFDNLAP